MRDTNIRKVSRKINVISVIALMVFSISFFKAQQGFEPETFRQWYQLGNISVSDDGKYSYFIRKYDDRKRDAVLLNNVTGNKIVGGLAVKSDFGRDFFITLDQDGVLDVINLRNEKHLKIDQVKDFYISENSNRCYLLMNDGQLDQLEKDQPKPIQIAEKISRLEISLDKKWMLAMSDQSSLLIQLETEIRKNLGSVDKSNFVRWNLISSSATFDIMITAGNHYKMVTYDKNGILIKEIDVENPGKDFRLTGFTDSGQLIAIRGRSAKKLQDSIEVWRTDDLALGANLNKREGLSFDALIIDPVKKTKTSFPYTEGTTDVMLVFDDQYLLEVMAYANENFTDEHLIPGIRLKNLSSGAVEFSVQRCPSFVPAKRGQLFYFEGKDWWMYDPVLKVKRNLTAEVDDQFFSYNRQNIKSTLPIGDLRFSEDQQIAYVTGKKNIWKMDTGTGRFTNLTRSKDKNISFGILNRSSELIEKMKWTEFNTIKEDWLLIKTLHQNQLQEGLIVVRDKKITVIEEPQIMQIDNVVIENNCISYTIENSRLPQELKMYDLKKKKLQSVYSSNEGNLTSMALPASELIYFTDKHGNETYTAVILPPDYDPAKKYPAIVRVYENTASSVKKFVSPSFYNQPGFNRSLAAMEGYIVIMPRIFYQINKPGESALEAVEESVNKTAEKYSIDRDRLGIIGESFGGFEVNYIIANTKMFKAAVSGVSLSDITASYFSMSKKFLRPDIWRYTDQSFRFSGNFYELKDVYIKQNPVFHADRIDTPLLIWTGKEDNHVDWEQSVSMFIALKSLEKPVELILFPKDGHALQRPSNQIQATIKIGEWFNKYLKK
jgi:dipeptidyl aminopeptidase/acylaminoacyl peptidase